MPLENALASVPGLAGYLGQEQFNQEQGLGQLKQLTGLAALQEHFRKQQEDAAYRAELAALGPNPTQDQLTAVAAKRATPNELLQTQQKSMDVKEAAKDRALLFMMTFSQKQDALDQAKELALGRASDKKEQDAINNQFKCY